MVSPFLVEELDPLTKYLFSSPGEMHRGMIMIAFSVEAHSGTEEL